MPGRRNIHGARRWHASCPALPVARPCLPCALPPSSAYEFLSSLDLDPDALYPCVPDLSGD